MLSKRHYVAIAARIKANMEAYHPYAIPAAQWPQLLADYFASDNPRFDRAKFLAACGIETDK